jgi:Rrf2 family iron-sulfur cluster assembly transcriptional regulator
MLFSKSFGYALRSVLYVSAETEKRGKIPLEKIAEGLNVPRHFLGKVMKRLVKEGILSSQKGPNGGFFINDRTLATPLIQFIHLTGEDEYFKSCILRLRKCDATRPCPLHSRAEQLRDQWEQVFSTTTVDDLLRKDQPGFIDSISIL